jgi:hypothetical protein
VPEMTEIQITHHVERVFREMHARPGSVCENPITGSQFVYETDPIKPQIELASLALQARDWFAKHGPDDALPLPLSYLEREVYKWQRRPIDYITAQYARSLEGSWYDVVAHPSFSQFASGLLWDHANGGSSLHFGADILSELMKRFPPRMLPRMRAYFWDAPPSVMKGWRLYE